MPERSSLAATVAASVAISFAAIPTPASSAVDQVASRRCFAHKTLLKCYLAKRMMREAIKEYQAILFYEPNNAQMHFDCGNALLQVGDKQRALAEFHAAGGVRGPSLGGICQPQILKDSTPNPYDRNLRNQLRQNGNSVNRDDRVAPAGGYGYGPVGPIQRPDAEPDPYDKSNRMKLRTKPE